MSILIITCIMLIIAFFSGFGVVGLLQHSNKNQNKFKNIAFITPIIGYGLSQLLFWLFYYASQKSVLSVFLAFGVIILINSAYFLVRYKLDNKFLNKVHWRLLNREEVYILIMLAAVFIISAWQYVAIGIGHYYHSANPDYFDGINGGLSYIKNIPLKLMDADFSINFPLQYSSQAFWYLILRKDFVDIFLLQSILNLFLTAIGIYWLVKYVFNASISVALLTAFWSTTGNFYLSTYFNGHIGSLIYLSIVPAFIGLLILWSRKDLSIYWLFPVVLLLIAIQLTYPGPVYFLLLPAIILIAFDRIILPLKLHEKVFKYFGFSRQDFSKKDFSKIKWFKIILVGLLLIAAIIIGGWLIYIYFEPRRISALIRTTVSWKITLYKEMFMIYWGVYPSGSSGSFSLLPLIASNDLLNNIAFIISIIVTIGAMFAAMKCKNVKGREYLFVYSLLYIPFFIIMRYFWGSPYFFYKFLYTNYFLTIVIIIPWVLERQISIRKIKSLFVAGLLISICLLNLFWNLAVGFDFYKRIYHQEKEINEFVSAMSQKQYVDTYLDIPVRLYNKVFKYILDKNKINTIDDIKSAKYLIQLKELHQVTYNTINPEKVVFSNNLFRVSVPTYQNRMTVETQYPPENNGEIDINWIGNQLTLQRNLLENSVLDVIKHIKNTGIDGKVFIDIFNSDLNDYSYLIINDIMIQNSVNIQKNVNKATYFLRIRGDQEDYKPLFSKNEFEKTIWQNAFLKLVYLPKEKRTLGNISPNYDYGPLFSHIKNNGNKVYLDIQEDDDMLSLPLKQKMLTAGITVAENPDSTTLICRYNFYSPLSSYNNYVLTHSNVKTVYRTNNRLANTYPWEIELLDMPLNGRKIITRDFRYNSRERFLSGKRREDLKCTITNLTRDAKYIRLLVAPGPSIDFAEFNLIVSSNNLKYKKIYKVAAPLTKIDLSLNDFKSPDSSSISFSLTGIDINGNNLLGHSLLPFDDRYLLYNVMAIELTDSLKIYSKNLVRAFNCRPLNRKEFILKQIYNLPRSRDIINPIDSNNIFLGLNWYPNEKYNEETFRWVGKDTAEIILNSINKRDHSLLLNLEPGPGCGIEPLKLKILYQNRTLQSGIISGRRSFEIQFPKEMYNNEPNQKIFKIVSNGNLKVPSDPRVLSYRVFNISLAKAGSKKGDIINENYLDQIEIGKGWYSLEKYNGELFRWVGKDTTEIILYDVDKKHHSLLLGLESGPGCGKEPLKLLIFYKNKIIQKEIINGRKNIEIQLPKEAYSDSRNEMILKLLTENGNYKIASDPRILNYRVFDVSLKQWELKKNDIVEINNIDQIQIGKGWYTREIFNNESFRWVGKEPAEVIITDLDTAFRKIKFNIEPGPGSAGKPLRIKMFLENRFIGEKTAIGREDLIIDLPERLRKSSNKPVVLKLLPISKNAVIKSDKRILNFRTFNISLLK